MWPQQMQGLTEWLSNESISSSSPPFLSLLGRCHERDVCSGFINQRSLDLVLDLVVAHHLYLGQNFAKLREIGLTKLQPQTLDRHILIKQPLCSILVHLF